MDVLLIEQKINLPQVDFNPDTGVLNLIGRSIPENPVKFYKPIESWVNNFIATNPKTVVFHIYLDYLNTHSTECVLVLIKSLALYFEKSNADIKIIWDYDEYDEDMLELGEDLASLVKIPFEFKEVKED